MKKLIEAWKREPLFSTFLLVAVIAMVGTGTVFAADTVAKSNVISEESAKKFAYLDAGVKEKRVNYATAELEKEGFRYVYDIEFVTDDAKYSYEVNSADGSILEREKEVIAQTVKPAKKQETADTQKVYISVDKAKQKALKHAGVNDADVTFSKAKLERDDGTVLYDVEFYTAEYEYEYEVEAYSGKILESSVETVEQAAPAQIGQAKQNAVPVQSIQTNTVQPQPAGQTPSGQENVNGQNAAQPSRNVVDDDDDWDDDDDDWDDDDDEDWDDDDDDDDDD